MPASCKHPQVRVVAREEDAEFVVCQSCGEIFDASEFADILNEVAELNQEAPADGPREAPGDREAPGGKARSDAAPKMPGPGQHR